MKSFDRWLADQQQVDTHEDRTIRMRCVSCGKEEMVDRDELANGDAGWYTSDHFSPGNGLCCSGPHCIP